MNAYQYPLMNDQLALEADMLQSGIASYRSAIEKAQQRGEEASTSYGALLIRRLLTPMVDAINEFLEASRSGGAGRRHYAAKYLEAMDPEVAAYITLKTVLDSMTKGATQQQAALAIAGALEDECWFRAFEVQQPKKFDMTEKLLEESTTRHRAQKLMAIMANRAGVQFEGWPIAQKSHLGLKLLDILREKTGLVEINLQPDGKGRTVYHVAPTKATLDLIGKNRELTEMMSPHYWPTIVPPKQWTNPFNGGYWSNEHRRVTLVKTRNRNYLTELKEMNPVAVYQAINRTQETPWKVNGRVLDVMRECMSRGLSHGGLPSNEPVPEPVKIGALAHDEEQVKAWRNALRSYNKALRKAEAEGVPCTHPVPAEKALLDAWTAQNGDTLKEWKHRAAEAHQQEVKRRSKHVQVEKTLAMAEKFRGYEAIYFPHSMDFRGRAYPLPMFLNPQGPDYAKGLLTFASGKPLGTQQAADWLAIHGGNSFGGGRLRGVKQDVDKRPLEDRVAWVEDNEDAILAVATDPMANLSFWNAADAPWVFLAFCFEWAGYKAEGLSFVSTLPCSLDGTCNGLQHYSAALRDPVGGAEVNLIPSDKPKDIYRRVAEVVTEKLRLFTPGSETVAAFVKKSGGRYNTDEALAWARKWLEFGINRKITKRPVMTLPYGSTQYSCREFIEDALKEAIADGAANVFGPFTRMVEVEDEETGEIKTIAVESNGIFAASLFLQGFVWDAIGEVVVAARVGMDWLKKCARLASKEGLPIHWTTADGLLVMQAYHDTKAREIKTVLDGKTVKLNLQEELPTLNANEMANGIAPNWVHSQDATAMRMYVNVAHDRGIRHFALVHDSYGTLAADCQLMQDCLKQAFVDLYAEHDPLAAFKVDIAMLVSDEAQANLPEMPEKGDLDLNLILQSSFFFS